MNPARVLLGAALATTLLAGCAPAPPEPTLTHAPDPVPAIDLSGVCGMTAIVDTTGEGYETRAEVVQELLDWFSAALADMPEGGRGYDPPLALEDDPVLLPIAVQGFQAALEALPAVEAADPEAELLEVTGMHDGLPAATVGIRRFGTDYLVDTYTYYWPAPEGGCVY